MLLRLNRLKSKFFQVWPSELICCLIRDRVIALNPFRCFRIFLVFSMAPRICALFYVSVLKILVPLTV